MTAKEFYEWAFKNTKALDSEIFHKKQKNQAIFWNGLAGFIIFILPFLLVFFTVAYSVKTAIDNPDSLKKVGNTLSEIAEDLTYYFATSEQVPSAVGLGVLVDTDGSVKQAGGFILQLMPFTSDEVIEKLEKRIGEMDSVTNMLERGLSPEGILEEILGDFGLEITDTLDTRFFCDCSKEKVSRALSTINKKDLDDIINDGESIEVKCQFCNKAYKFEIDELKEIRES